MALANGDKSPLKITHYRLSTSPLTLIAHLSMFLTIKSDLNSQKNTPEEVFHFRYDVELRQSVVGIPVDWSLFFCLSDCQ